MKSQTMKLTDNTILITGGSSGIGLELATRLLKLGNTVIITGRNTAKLDQIRQKWPQMHTFQSDVSDPAAIGELYTQVTRQFPDLNFLINNAGEMRRLDLHDKTLDVYNINREIEINLSGPIRMVQQFLPWLKARKNAAIMNVTSGLALVPFPLAPVYSATKAGLRAYTRSLRTQVKNDNIKVFELLPPVTKTPLINNFQGDVNSRFSMDPGKLAEATIRRLKNDHYEILPGVARILKFMSRLAPGLIFHQFSKIAEKAFAQPSQPAP